MRRVHISLLQAVQIDAVYPNKMWFLYGMEGGEWWEWEGVDVNVNCTKEDMKRFLNKAITVVPNFDGEMASEQPTDEEVCASALYWIWVCICGGACVCASMYACVIYIYIAIPYNIS